MRNFHIMHKNIALAHVSLDPLVVVQFSDDAFYRQFKKHDSDINFYDVMEWIGDRCFPKSRDNYRHLLEVLGLSDVGYDPIAITEVTHGIMRHDYLWMKFEGEELEYNDLPGHRE